MRNLSYSSVKLFAATNDVPVHSKKIQTCNSAALRNKTFLHILILHSRTGNTEEIWLPEARGI